MTRLLLVLLVALGCAPAVFAGPASPAPPDAATLGRECYAKVGPLLQSADGRLTPEARGAYLEWAEKAVLLQLKQNNQAVPDACLAEVRANGTTRDALFGSVFPPDPSILQNYAQLRAQLGPDFTARYRSFVIAVALAKRVKGVEAEAEIKSIGHDYQPGFWVDESLQVPGSEADKEFVRKLAAFMKQSQIAAYDLYQNPGLQAQLKTYLAGQAVGSDRIAQVRKSVGFGEQLKNALILLGQRPAAREAKPATVAWMRHLAAHNAAKPTSTPAQDGRPMTWPLFPLDTAPWPLLMPLAHPIPLSEANYVWEAFQGEHGPDRYHTYGPYRGDDDVVPDSLRPSQWFWDAWPDRIIHGGMCVPISKGTVDLYSALGKPAMWAGQPGHANLISFQYVGGAWTAEIEQAFAGGPDVTTAQWYFDEIGAGIRYRDLYYWVGAEHQLGLALSMNVGLKSYMDTRLAANIFRLMPEADRPKIGVNLLRTTLAANPFNPELWYLLAGQTTDVTQAVALCEAARQANANLLSGSTLAPANVMRGSGMASAQYWQTLTQFMPLYSLLSHPAPKSEADMRVAHSFLKTAYGVSPDALTAYVDNRAADIGVDALKYDQDLARQNDAYGLLRMGQRYRDGDGVAQSDAQAKECLAQSAGQGDMAAATLLGYLNPVLPPDMITVTASSVYSPDQAVKHLADGAGLVGLAHDNEEGAKTMWHTAQKPTLAPAKTGNAPAPAWVRFNFARPVKFDSILIWNHNQPRYTDRGFRRTRIYGSIDGTEWIPLTGPKGIELPRANGKPALLPTVVPNESANQPFKAVLIAADAANGNYGSEYYGLSAVRFAVHPLSHLVPAKAVTVTASSVYSPQQDTTHLVNGWGMLGDWHDNEEGAKTMWHTALHPAAQPPAPTLAPSPAWARFDFAQPQQIGAALIWNHNQASRTDRGFRKTRIYGSIDGATWHLLTAAPTIELPYASGLPMSEPTAIPLVGANAPLKSVIIAAEETDGNYGGDCFGLSAVRFVIR